MSVFNKGEVMENKDSSVLGVKVLGERLLVQVGGPANGEKKLASGIIIPGTSKEEKREATTGVLVGVGPDVSGSFKDLLCIGYEVLFNKWAGTPIKVDDNDYLVVKTEEVLAIISGNDL